ncbi:MAG: hypothetical protein DWQ37_14050 [Planctomycetota bacterium]|nr:MAG: hypothetical protein DWQ37_14050 [Planctomycetota bacterium]
MLRTLLRRKLDSEEKKLGVSVDYLRHVLDVSPSAFMRFAAIMPFANSRKVLPKEAWFVAQILVLQQEDCGPCLQIGVNQARQAAVDPELVRAALAGNLEAMPPELADVYRFAQAVSNPTGDDGGLREALRKRYGERGLIELAYAIASARIPPTVKRCLGYAESCSAAPVEV